MSYSSNKNTKPSVVILGGGVTGLSAANRLSESGDFSVHVLEKETEVGGLCRSFRDGDFIFDYGPHKFYSLVPGVTDSMCDLMGDEFLVRDKTQNLYLDGKYFKFPLSLIEVLTRFSPIKSFQILWSFGIQTIKNLFARIEVASYEDFVVSRFGKALFQKIFEPMAFKMFGNPKTLDKRLAEVRISSPGLVSVIKQVLSPKKVDPTVSAPTFHYPKNGFGMIPSRLRERSEKNGATYHLGVKVTKIEIQNGKVHGVRFTDSSGKESFIQCDHLIYTIPIQAVADLIPELPADVRQAARFTRFRHTIVYYFVLKSKPVLPAMWVFYPESKFRFGRLSEMTKFSPSTAPEGHTTLMVDFTCETEDPAWSMNDEELGKMLLSHLEPLGLFKPHQIVKKFSKRFKNFYPVYETGYQEQLAKLRGLETRFQNLYFIGRLGDFNYNNSDQCFDMGYRVADYIKEKGSVGTDWGNLRKERFENYRIVD